MFVSHSFDGRCGRHLHNYPVWHLSSMYQESLSPLIGRAHNDAVRRWPYASSGCTKPCRNTPCLRHQFTVANLSLKEKTMRKLGKVSEETRSLKSSAEEEVIGTARKPA